MISKFSVKKPYTVLVGVVLAIVLGVVSFTKMTADLLPNISLPYVLIMTTYVGASPETVETVVTQPIEASMATVSNIESVSSVSSENYSMVILEFAQSADMNAASLEIRESLDQIKSYWDDSVGNPIIMKLNPDMLPVMIAAVGVDGMDIADISIYVQEEVAPELESIEGVASVSATGLLEESVNVVIRQEKVDALNEKVFAAIDDKMKEAEEELAEGRKELEDGKKDIADGKKELADGQAELNDGKKELEDGKQELEDAQADTADELAAAKTQLLTAKGKLDAVKTQLDTAKQLNDGITKIDAGILQMDTAVGELNLILNGQAKYDELYQAYAAVAATPGEDAAAAEAKAAIEAFKTAYTGNSVLNTMISEMGAADPTGALASGWEALKLMDWSDPTGYYAVTQFMLQMNGMLQMPGEDGVSQAAKLQAQITELETQKAGLTAQRASLAEALNAQTNGLGYSAFVETIKKSVGDVDEQLAKVNDGLKEIEKGELTAAIEFANASAQIGLGEYQMDQAQSQLDSIKEQLESGLSQLEDAEEQLEEGEKQLADAKEDAYEQADMNNILTVDTIKNLLVAQNFSMPAGYVTEEGNDYLVRVGDKPSTVEELQAMPLMDMHMDGVPVITLGDVADVFYTDNSAEIYTNVNGSAGVMLTVQKQTGYSTGSVSDLLTERFEKLMEDNKDLTIITLMDQGIYIDLVMDSIIGNVVWGGLLAILILIVFLRDMKPTLVIACSIPISLVTAIVCMYFSGVTLNVISLSGLALGIGMLVDNSIVVIENIYRLRGEGYSMREAAIEGAREVAGAIVASTLTTVCVFLPIVFTEGITRQLFVDMGLTIAYSLLASLVIALTVVPAMASKMLTNTKEQKEGRFFTGMTNLYVKVLAAALKVKPLVYILVVALLVVSVIGSLAKGTSFMPEMDSTQLTVNVQLDEEATLAETAALTDKVVEKLFEIEDVENVGAMSATSTTSLLGGGSGSTNATTIYVVTKEEKTLSNEAIAEMIKEKTADLPAEISVTTSSMDMSALGGSGITVQVRGRDLDVLREIATEVADVLETVEGTAQVNDGLGESDVELRITIDRDKAVNYGLTVAQVFSQIASKIADATSATTLVAADKDYNVYVSNGSDSELTREMVKEIAISGTDEDGKKVEIPLSDIASFADTMSMSSINRADQTRYVSVTASIAEGYNVGIVANEAEERLALYDIPDGYRLVFSGENETINDALGQLVLMLLLAIVFMYLIMVAQFQSLLSPFIVMFTIPLAFTGGFLGLIVSGSELSVIAMVGFVMLSGIIVNNGIVLIDYINQLRESGMEKTEAILDAGRTRLRPVLMTALTTILAMGTMVFSNDMGSEMAKPMATVTIGGLLYGTVLTLIVIPCVYDNLASLGRKKKELCEKNV